MSATNLTALSVPAPGAEETAAAVAHDLRLPLSHIKGFVSALRRTDVHWDAATRQDFLAEIDLEADRMADLIESLVEAAQPDRIKQIERSVSMADPAVVVDGAVHRVRGLIGDRQVRRHVASGLPAARLDVRKMERVLANLLQNAIKYTTEAPIDITARVTPEDELEFLVEDRGPGVPEAHREEIFQPFVRSHQPNGTTVQGNGLGLAISHSIVLAHGGRMQVTDRPGGGASFSVVLPLPPSKERGDDTTSHSRRRRRSTNAQTSVGQSESKRLRGPHGRGWLRSPENDRGAPIRSAAA
jgi:two-component system sensor histidine kinase KdpD